MRVAVIGVGHLGRHHARVLAELEGVTLSAVADARIEQARAVAEPLGAEAVADYRDLLGRVDAVSVAVPTCLHREVAGAFLERGIPCMVEKPLASSLAQAEELVGLASRMGATLQVGHIERFNPALAALEAARLRPKFITAVRSGTYTFRSTDIGVVLDLMIHDIDLILSLNASPVVSVEAMGVSVFGRHEDVANARIRFQDGCVADLTASRASYSASRTMRLWGAEGYATVDFGAKTTTVIRPGERLRRGELDVTGVDLTQPSAVREHLFGKVLRVDKVQAEGREPLALELEDFVRAIRTGTPPTVSGEDGLRAIRVADAVLRSLRAHAWDGTPDGPAGPFDLPEPIAGPIEGLAGPMLFRHPRAKQGATPEPERG
jgi:predicted dehydrogenase